MATRRILTPGKGFVEQGHRVRLAVVERAAGFAVHKAGNAYLAYFERIMGRKTVNCPHDTVLVTSGRFYAGKIDAE